MNPMDYTKAFGDFWAAQGKALLDAQGKAGQMMADGMQAMASGTLPVLSGGFPGMPTDLAAAGGDLAHANQAVMELWSAATALSASLVKAVPGETDGTVEATFQKMVDPRAWLSGADEMGEVLGRMAEGPRLADLFDLERRYARVLQAWMGVRRAGVEHNAVVLEAWVRAGKAFSEELAGHVGLEREKMDAKAAMALWTDMANRELLESQRSEPFLRTQTAMIRASTDLRLAQQELVEHFGKQYGFPTRTELDDVHRTLTELRREVRTLKRAARQPEASPAPAEATARPAPRREKKRMAR